MNNKIKIITFSGVDGAGKTTILTKVKELIENKYNKEVVILRHRPSILPILSAIKYGKKEAEKKTQEVLPRTGKNKSKVSSFVRFFYYLLDYVYGQWVVYFKHTSKGKIIIYDRYYFDFINDSRRTNIDLDSGFIKFFYKFVFKPKLNIFLYADPDVILSRKQEMDKKSIVDLTNKYKSLFNELSNKHDQYYLPIENIEIDETMTEIENFLIKG
jgi:thymidylate kinase